MADRQISKRLKGKLMDTGTPVWNGNLGNDRTATTKDASMQKQLGTENGKSNEDRQEKNDGVKVSDLINSQCIS